MQRCPAVPTAPKAMAGITISMSAVSSTMMQLLPPNSRMVFPNRLDTASLTYRPIFVEPVKETSRTRGSLIRVSPIVEPGPITVLKIWGASTEDKTSLHMFCTAIVQSGVVDEGFQMVVLPQMAAINAFQLQTATGKLKALITPTIPRGCHCSYIRCSTRSECIVFP